MDIMHQSTVTPKVPGVAPISLFAHSPGPRHSEAVQDRYSAEMILCPAPKHRPWEHAAGDQIM
jgi:hypothetical protein